MYISRFLKNHFYIFPTMLAGTFVLGGYSYYEYNRQREELYQKSKQKFQQQDEERRLTYLNELQAYKRVEGNKIPIRPTTHIISMRGFINIDDKVISLEVAHVPKSPAPFFVSIYDKVNGSEVIERVEKLGKLEKNRWTMPVKQKEKVEGKYLVVETYYNQVLGGAYISPSNSK